ncbi:hypothetical protein ACTPOK_29265 [Streptomyces inhibens]
MVEPVDVVPAVPPVVAPVELAPPLMVVTAVKPPSSGTPVRPLVVGLVVVVATVDPPPGSLHPGGEVTTLPLTTRVWQITSGADDVAFA